MNRIEDQRKINPPLHGVESTHHESVPVKESFNGETV
jgi:hypothetical protein